MKKWWKYSKNFLVTAFVMVMTSQVMAALPTPPSEDQPTGSQDWIDVGGIMVNRTITIVCIAMGAIILVAAAAGIVKAYHTAHEKQDLGHFFKMLIVGLIASAIGIGLVYAGWNIVQS